MLNRNDEDGLSWPFSASPSDLLTSLLFYLFTGIEQNGRIVGHHISDVIDNHF